MLEIKWGLGWIARAKRPIRLWYVVVDGKTRASFTSREDAHKWACKRYRLAYYRAFGHATEKAALA